MEEGSFKAFIIVILVVLFLGFVAEKLGDSTLRGPEQEQDYYWVK
jgi:hypothetical protein